MLTTRMAMVPLSVLWEYREFKRDEIPAPRIPFIHDHSVDEVTHHVDEHGMEPLELSIVKDRALLTDGNHRIVAARRLGMENVPVKVTVYFGNVNESFYDHTLERFKPISPELESILKKIFLGGMTVL